MSAMEYRRIGGSDLRVSALSFGTATFGGSSDVYRAWGATDVAEATSLIDIALDDGVNMFDTDDVYSHGLAEEILGKALGARRNQLRVSTKGGFRMFTCSDYVCATRRHLTTACEAILMRLGTDHFDLC